MPDLHLQTDRMIRIGGSVHFTRIGGYPIDEIPASDQTQDMGEADISEALQLIAGVRSDVVLYGCTSARLTHGLDFDRDLTGRIKTATGANAITVAGAMLAALSELGANKVGFASPYAGEVNAQAIRFLADAGIETVKCADVGKALSNHEQGALTPDDVFDLAVRADCEDA